MRPQRAILAGALLAAAGAIVIALAWPDAPPPRPRQLPLEIPSSSEKASKPANSPVPLASDGAAWTPPIRVNVTPAAVRSLTLAVDSAWEVRPVGSTKVLGQGSRIESCEVTATGNGFQIGKSTYPVSRLEIVPTSSPSIWIEEYQYRGQVRLHRRTDGTFVAVNVLPLEDYIAAVVDGEMPATFGDEARKAQAVVARTYALWRLAEAAGHPEFDLYSTSRSQKYLGYQYRTSDGRRLAGESDSSRRAARATSGVVCTWQGRLFCTYYSAVCGGKTTAGNRVFSDAAEPHQSVACDWCRESDLYRWSRTLSRTETSKAIGSYFAGRKEPFGALRTLTNPPAADGQGGTSAVSSGTAKLSVNLLEIDDPAALFTAGDGQRTRTISAVDLRRTLPSTTIHSPYFVVHSETDAFRFEGRGHGHGVGFCQWGARGMAAAGKDCYEILRHYYRGVAFVSVTPPKDRR